MSSKIDDQSTCFCEDLKFCVVSQDLGNGFIIGHIFCLEKRYFIEEEVILSFINYQYTFS